jgi:hypothetical protein
MSSVAALPVAVNATSFPVSWSGTDSGGPGIASFQVFVADNGGAFTPWQTFPAATTSANYTGGQDGHTYGFYSIATDLNGTAETPPSQAQATTQVDLDKPTSTVAALPAFTTATSFTVSWSGQDNTGGSGIASYQVYYSVDGGPFTAAATFPASTTSAPFQGALYGHTYSFYSVATDNAGNVQDTPAAAQATTSFTYFTDSFDRADSASLGIHWKQVSGSAGILNNRLAFSGTAAGLLTYSDATLQGSGSLGNSMVQADLALPATGKQYAGVVARYSSTGGGSCYLGEVVASNGAYTAYLYRKQGGTFTQLGRPAPLSSGTGTLRLEAVGNSLELLFNGRQVVWAYDSALSSGATGVWGSPGATLDNFAGGPQTLSPVGLPFTDSFTQPDGSPLSRSWFESPGNFTVQGGRLRANAPGPNLAAINLLTALAADVAVQADIALPSPGQYAGVVARDGSAGLYLGEVVASGSASAPTYTAYLYKNVGGTFTQLGKAVKLDRGTGTLRLEAVGFSLKLFFNGALLTYAFDTALASGFAGVWESSGGATLANFSAAAITRTAVALPFSDTFTQNDGSQLSLSWTEETGNFSVTNNQIRANDPGINEATVNQATMAADVAVQADIAVGTTGTQYAGVVARNGVPGFYLAEVVGVSGKFTAHLYRFAKNTFTPLGQVVPLGTGTGTLLLEVRGTSLKVFFNGTLETQAYDSALTSGFVGIWGSGGATLDNFSAAASTAPQALPFSDSFTQSDGTELSGAWTGQTGDFTVNSNRARANAAGANLATVNLTTAATDLAVQADLALPATGKQYAGVVARYSSKGGGSYYLGEVVASNGTYTAYLFKNVGGTFTQLGQPVTVGSGTGTLRLQAAGRSLKLFFNGTLLIHTFDGALPSGTAGIWASNGATLDNFSAAVSTTPVTVEPFSDNFAGAAGSQLSSSWTEQAGNFSVSASQGLRANDPGVNLATVNLFPPGADVAVQADIGLLASQYAGLVARYSGTGDASMYVGEVVGKNGVFTAYILRHVGSTWAQMSSSEVSRGTALAGTLRFVVKNSNSQVLLQLFFNGTLVADASDSDPSALTAPGLVGLRAGTGATYGAFSVAAPS